MKNELNYSIEAALWSLKPGAQWSCKGGVYSGIDWLDSKQTKPTESEVNAEVTRLKAIEGYQTPRREQYPTIQEQLDMQYWDKKNGTNKWVEAVDKVKSDNPKP